MNTCAVCKQSATLKCSACKSIFYCSREHQTNHWKKHKVDCARMTLLNATMIQREGKCYLFELPHDLIIFMLDFLKSDKFQGKKIYELTWDIRFFLNCNKKCYGYKREVQLIRMGRIKSTEYMASATFRERVLKTIMNPRHQLSLTLVRPEVIQRMDRNFYDLGNLSNTYTISLADSTIKKFAPIEDVEEFILENCTTTDLTPFAKLKVFHYYSREKTLTTDLSCLENVEEIKISCPKVSNYQNLRNAKRLEFTGVTELYDVSYFAEAHTLMFYYCPNISNLHRLANVHSLTISNCPVANEDVAMFANIHTLTITDNSNISDISKLTNVHEIRLDGCKHITDLSGLTSVEKFTFRGFPGTSLRGLENAKIVDIPSSVNVTDLSPLVNVEELNILRCSKITDISMLKKVRKLDISFCVEIDNFLGLEHLEHLTMKTESSGKKFTIRHGFESFLQLKEFIFGHLSNYDELMEFFLQLQEQITLTRKQNSLHLPFPAHHLYGSLPKMTVHNSSFKNHPALSNVLSLTLSDIYDLGEVPFFPYLRQLEVINCRSFKKLSGLPCLNSLLINMCSSLKTLAIIDTGVNPFYQNDLKKKFPIYEVFLFDCENLREIQLGRQVQYFQVNECYHLDVIRGSHFINYLWVDAIEQGDGEYQLKLA